jgi:hypothetical protein
MTATDLPRGKAKQRKHLEVVYPDISSRKSIVAGFDVSEAPRYTVKEVAKFFFGKSSHWVRWKEKEGDLNVNGKQVADHRTDGGARYYTLADVEKMAHALCRNGAIDAHHLKYALRLVRIEAQVWGYLPPENSES